ncbi:MAG: flagellar biosynthesis protein FlhF [Nitrospiraceae bacterium]|nr:MAG: flagellar biosynthesis protein FlhF [Nitrospiraceae bacterium]
MKIKKFQARSFSEALTCIKRELGDNALIMSSEDKSATRSYVEVTAAVDYDMEPNESGAYSPPPSSQTHGSDISELKNEIRSLRDSVEAVRNMTCELILPAGRKKLFQFLRGRSIREDFAVSLVERAQELEDLETAMTDDMDCSRPFGRGPWDLSCRHGRRILMLIGPTGAGKTTTVAKLASRAVKEGKKAAIIGLDTFKVGAMEQIRIYANMLGVPVEVASNAEDMKMSIKKFSGRDILLIDTTGQNPRDGEYIKNLKDLYRTGLPIETQLLLSASSDGEFLMETQKHYSPLPVDYIVFTKTDEAVKLGSIYNLCRVYKKPVAYITTGQRVPGNIEFVDNKKLTNIILRTGSA